MSASDSTKFNEMNKLLQELKELHAPDRCEGLPNYVWHGMQRLTKAVTRSQDQTPQQKITNYWNERDLSTHRSDLKKLASTSLHDFYFVCRELDENRAKAFVLSHNDIWELTNGETKQEIATKQNDIDDFIDKSFAPGVQKMFDIMIVQWAWRGRMLTAWEIH